MESGKWKVEAKAKPNEQQPNHNEQNPTNETTIQPQNHTTNQIPNPNLELPNLESRISLCTVSQSVLTLYIRRSKVEGLRSTVESRRVVTVPFVSLLCPFRVLRSEKFEAQKLEKRLSTSQPPDQGTDANLALLKDQHNTTPHTHPVW